MHNFISVSQAQIGENADNLNKVESYIMTGNYRQLWQNKFNITNCKQNVGTKNEINLLLLLKASVWIQ